MLKLSISFLIGIFVGIILSIKFSGSVISEKRVLGESTILTQPDYIFVTPTLTSSPVPSPTPTPRPTSTPKPTQIPTPTAIPTPLIAPGGIDHYFDQYSLQFGVDGQLLRRIASCESKFNPSAVNGNYAGLYQFLPSIWQTYREQLGADINPDLRFNADEAIKTAAYAVSKGKLFLWPVCGKK